MKQPSNTRSLTLHNVFRYDLYILIPIGTGVFMPEAHHMAKFVDDDTEFITIFANGYGLRPRAALANERATSARVKAKIITANYGIIGDHRRTHKVAP